MIRLSFFQKREREKFIPRAVEAYAGKNYKILKTPEGKPYIEGDPFFISLSHSGELCSFAVSQIKVGIDTELLRDKNYNAVLLSFPEAEREEIKCPRDFFMHWTAREAFVKYCGGKLWKMIKKLSFTGGRLFYDGLPAAQEIRFCFENNAVTAICADKTDFAIITLQ